MARYYRRRYTRVVKPKKKWATNIKEWTFNSSTAGSGGSPLVLGAKNGWMTKLCVNSAVDSNPTPVVLKAGNFKVQMDINMLGAGGLTAAAAYVMYLPEGIETIGANLEIDFNLLKGNIERHPEWILAWKQIGFESDGASRVNYDKISFSSRLKRNLNSGDCIALCVLFDSPSETAPGSISFRAISQFWTCAN